MYKDFIKECYLIWKLSPEDLLHLFEMYLENSTQPEEEQLTLEQLFQIMETNIEVV